MNVSQFTNHEIETQSDFQSFILTQRNFRKQPQSKFFSFPNSKEDAYVFIQQYEPHAITNYTDLLQDKLFKVMRSTDSLYWGQVEDGKRHGIGIYINNRKRLYEGDWENDVKQGRGYEVFPTGSWYEGEFVNGKPEGVGKFHWQNGETYDGEWNCGRKHGSGIWKGSKGDSYIGEWKHGVADGYGVHVWINGDRYEGQFKQCLKEGHGQERFANGDTYIGDYVAGKPQGQGEYYWANGASYKGEFLQGLRHGQGLWKRGQLSDSYEGTYQHDKKHGKGVQTWVDGNRYEGDFVNDVREGFGVMHWADGSYYKGQWKAGIQDGQGMLMVNSEIFEGIFYGTNLVQEVSKNIKVNQLLNESKDKVNKMRHDIILPSLRMHTNERIDSPEKSGGGTQKNHHYIDKLKIKDKQLLMPQYDEQNSDFEGVTKLVDTFTQTFKKYIRPQRGHAKSQLQKSTRTYRQPLGILTTTTRSPKGLEQRMLHKLHNPSPSPPKKHWMPSGVNIAKTPY